MTSARTPRRDYAFDFKSDKAFGEIKARTTAIRVVRDALVKLINELVQSEDSTAYLVLVDPQITVSSLNYEFEHLKAGLRSEIACRLHLVIVNRQEITNIPVDISLIDRDFLIEKILASKAVQSPLLRPDMQSEVLRTLIHQWVRRRGPMTFDWLARTVGCTYRTVANTVDRLGPAVERSTEQGIELKYFPTEAWGEFAVVSRKARSTINYLDRSNQPRSPESLVKRLQKLDRTNIAVGGVPGAKHYCPELDIIGSPRLDLCVHAPGKHVDLGFVEELDPALKRTDDPHAHVQLALHFIRRKESLFEYDGAGIAWADPVECLADLIEARLDALAMEFETYLAVRGAR